MKLSAAKKLSTLVLASFTLFAFTSLTDKANFSGSWALNEGKSDFGQRGARFAVKTIKADQKADAIAITRTSPSFNGGEDVTTTENLTFDGKEVQSTGVANSTKKSTLKWAEDGQTFTITSNTSMERNGQTFEFSSTETWSLSDGGKTLTINVVSKSPRGETTTKAVYDKQ